jgi:hypothetical protein
VAAIRAAQLGLKTAIVEKGPKPEWGGTCLNWGCIPTKALLHDAYLYSQIQHAEKFGIDVPAPKLNLDNVMKHKELVVKRGLMGVEALLKKNKVTLLVGFGKVVKPGVVRRRRQDLYDQEHRPGDGLGREVVPRDGARREGHHHEQRGALAQAGPQVDGRHRRGRGGPRVRLRSTTASALRCTSSR